LATLAKSVIGTAIFLGVSFTIGRRVVFWLIRWTNDTFESELPVISLVLAITFGLALITNAIGVHDVLGAFVAGILVGQSPILTRQIDQQLRGVITALFMPIFFGLAGITADLTILADPKILMLTAGLVAIATLGKFSGAFAGGMFGGLKFPESLAIACGMNARGSTEVIVATIGLSMGVLSQDLFTMIVTMAVLTTLAMPPSLRWALARLPMREEERQRIAREEFEAKGFMPNVERMLLAVDDSPNGKFMAHLTGLLAGRRGTPTTLLRVRPELQGAQSKSEKETGTEASLQAGGDVARTSEKAEQAAADAATREEMTGKADEPAPEGKAAPRQTEPAQKENAAKPSAPAIPLTRAEATAETAESMIARESRKGYDLLMVGVDDTVGPDGALHEDVARIVAGFEGPIGVVIARGLHRDAPTRRLKILVPVSGNNVSRRAAEVAVMLARAQDVPVTFLYVGGKSNDRPRSSVLHQHEHAALKELVTWAERYDTEAQLVVRTDLGPHDAILREVKRNHFDLVVMGVNRRPGEALFFGNVAGAVIADAEASVLLLSS
jgi:nucleotide-binding universal stress UspA family protein